MDCYVVCAHVPGGGGGHSQRREGELQGIDQDFDETQVEVNMAGIICYAAACMKCIHVMHAYISFSMAGQSPVASPFDSVVSRLWWHGYCTSII